MPRNGGPSGSNACSAPTQPAVGRLDRLASPQVLRPATSTRRRTVHRRIGPVTALTAQTEDPPPGWRCSPARRTHAAVPAACTTPPTCSHGWIDDEVKAALGNAVDSARHAKRRYGSLTCRDRTARPRSSNPAAAVEARLIPDAVRPSRSDNEVRLHHLLSLLLVSIGRGDG